MYWLLVTGDRKLRSSIMVIEDLYTWVLYSYSQENIQLLKHLFKKMDPSVMRTSAQSNHGEIQLSFKYEATKKLLLVKVIKCRGLSAKDLCGHTADPYVKVKKRVFTNPLFMSSSTSKKLIMHFLDFSAVCLSSSNIFIILLWYHFSFYLSKCEPLASPIFMGKIITGRHIKY